MPAQNAHPLDVASAIKSRRTVRHYRPDTISDATLNELIDLTLAAPSSWNLQDRHLVVVRSREGLGSLTRATGGQPQPQEAPVIVVFLADLATHKRDRAHIWQTARDNGAWSEEFIGFFSQASQGFQDDLERAGRLREYAVKDAMIAASFLMLAATAHGIASSPMNGWDEAMVKEAVGATERNDVAVALLVALGYPADERRSPGRQPQAMNVYQERFTPAWPDLSGTIPPATGPL
jgi:nitroreductase